MTTEKTYNMRQPEGIYVRSKVVFDRHTFGIQQTNQQPLLDAPVTKKICRVLRKDPIWSPRGRNNFNVANRAQHQAEIPGFSVINRIQNKGESKHDFFKNYFFVGLSTGTMEWHAIKTDSDIRTAVDIQGRTWMHNYGTGLIRAGDKIMMEIDESTEAAERRMNSIPHSDDRGEIPDQRYTAFPAVWNIEVVRDGLIADWGRHLRGAVHAFPSTVAVAIELRRMAQLGVLLHFGYGDPNNRPVDGADFINVVSNELQQPGGSALGRLLMDIQRGGLDSGIAALLTPQDDERIVRQRIIPRRTPDSVAYVHSLQVQGIENLTRVVDKSIGEAGRDRVIGTALTNANVGDQFGILLTG